MPPVQEMHTGKMILAFFGGMIVTFYSLKVHESSESTVPLALHRLLSNYIPRRLQRAHFHSSRPHMLRAVHSFQTAPPVCVNHLDRKKYAHHPVMLEIASEAYELERDNIIEWNGLKVPAEYDCDIFNKNGKFWGNHHYFVEVQSRWSACWTHKAALDSGLTLVIPTLPFVDDEYNEQVAVYQSVLRAKSMFVVAELGARWGTWAARSIAFLKHRRPELQYEQYLAEIYPENCLGIERVMKINNLRFHLDCKPATAEGFSGWARNVDHVDLIDMDIQGAELDLVPALMELFNKKVYRVIVGTHSTSIHETLIELFKKNGWIFIWSHKMTTNTECVDNFVRGHTSNKYPTLERFNWSRLMKEGCYHSTPRGPVANWDGEIIVDNPRFVDRSKALTMDDAFLRYDDLIRSDSS